VAKEEEEAYAKTVVRADVEADAEAVAVAEASPRSAENKGHDTGTE
jgi:hypothetical protein